MSQRDSKHSDKATSKPEAELETETELATEAELEAELDAERSNKTDEPGHDDNPLARKIPLPLKIFGSLGIISGLALVPELVVLIIGLIMALRNNTFDGEYGIATLVIFGAQAVLMLALSIMFIVLGIRLLRNKRRHAAQLAEAMIAVMVLVILCEIMLAGFGLSLIPLGVVLIVLIALSSYVDPSLAEERTLKRKLRKMETREAAEDGTLGRDETGRGYIKLNFFNLFWIFVVCCVIGLVIETAYHYFVVDPGHYQDRAGMLFGPFSPIYGFGAVLMTVALNRFHDRNIFLIFLVSALIGGAFEYATSWFMQFAFGIVAWDYTGTFLSIDGRTNGMFMAMWGVLGVIWIKFLLPGMLKLVNLIPWNWRYSVTTICAALMIVDGGMTLLSLDCWYQRMAGQQPDTAVEQFFAEHFDNQYMAERFQSMSIDPSNATRSR